ncbi:MAG: P-type conjugative transfer protein VirB9 [Burkholderiales bacterium]|nr:P-type conjugative transfer protein VirB9 [Burkholderiales bacterium]
MRAILLAVLLLASTAATAEIVPQGGRHDARVKVVAFNPEDVVKVVGHYGYSTDIVFASYEDVAGGAIAVGDSDAWEVAPAGNHLFVKPRAKGAVTNMTVVTSKRTYQFALDAREIAGVTRGDNASMFFEVRFTYPDDEAAAAKAIADQRRREDAERRMQSLLNSPVVPKNYNYYGCGTRDLWPTEVFDDGRFTYLRFPAAQEIPAIFVVNSDKTESLVNGGMHDEQYVVQATARKLVLRRGKSVACLENRSFNPWGVGTPQGTTNPNLIRKVKESAPHVEAFPEQAQSTGPGASQWATPPEKPQAQPQLPPMPAPTPIVVPMQPQIDYQPPRGAATMPPYIPPKRPLPAVTSGADKGDK